jgi:transcriptional regulator with GAF, ATPase, and Fis domain
VIGPAQVPEEVRGQTEPLAEGGRSYQTLRTEGERRIVLTALERNEWHITRSAEALGLADHASLLKIMRRLGIHR